MGLEFKTIFFLFTRKVVLGENSHGNFDLKLSILRYPPFLVEKSFNSPSFPYHEIPQRSAATMLPKKVTLVVSQLEKSDKK